MSGVDEVKMLTGQRLITIGWTRLFGVKAGLVLSLVMTIALVA
jgi:hypothetical protein